MECQMALITKLDKILDMGLPDGAVDYLKSLYHDGSEAVKRIHSLTPPSFVRFDVTGDIFAMEQTFVTKDRADCFFESHRKYVDIQIIIGGTEQLELADISRLMVDKEYDAEKDLITYKDYGKACRLVLQRFDAAVFYPDDAHLCVSRFDIPERVYKTVLKVPAAML